MASRVGNTQWIWISAFLLLANSEFGDGKPVDRSELVYSARRYFESVKTMCPTLRLELMGTPREKEVGMSATEIAWLLEREDSRRFVKLYNNDFFRAYMMAVFGTLQTFALSDCNFISGDIVLDLRVPLAGAITSGVQNVHGVSGSVKIITHHAQYLQFSHLARIVNKDERKPAIELITFRTNDDNCRPLTLANLLRYKGKLKITAYLVTGPETSVESGSVEEDLFHEHDTTLHVEWKSKKYNLEKSGVAKTECTNGVSPRDSNGDQKCCADFCKGGCYFKGADLVCTHCKAPKFWSVDGKKCVSCEGQRRIDGYCLDGNAVCPAPLVSISATDCAFNCPAGQTIVNSLDRLYDGRAKHAVCEECDISFDGSDFSQNAPRACPKTCSHYGLLTLFNGLEGCQIVIGKIIINQWTMGQRTTAAWHHKFMALLESFDSIYGDLIIHDLFNVVTFNYLAKLRRVEGTLSFINNDILRHIALNSIVPKGIRKLQVVRNPQFNLHSRIDYFDRIAATTFYDFNLRPTSYQPFKEDIKGLYKAFGAEYPTLDQLTCPADRMYPFLKGNDLECKSQKPIDPLHCSPLCAECGNKRRTSVGCKSCKYYLIMEQNLKTCSGKKCPYSYYLSDKMCKRCHRNCLTCNGPSGEYKKDCVRCQILYFDVANKKPECFPYIPMSYVKGTEDPFSSVFGTDNLLPFEPRGIPYD